MAAAFGAAADAIAVTTPASAADAIRLLRKQDAGRAALLLAGAPDAAVQPRDPASRPRSPVTSAAAEAVGTGRRRRPSCGGAVGRRACRGRYR